MLAIISKFTTQQPQARIRACPKMITCHFCGGCHHCRECPIEISMSSYLKKKVGIYMEHFVAENVCCPECSHSSLFAIKGNTPSLDIICKNCFKLFEVKSKCLSIDVLPADIKLHHGTYTDYIQRVDEGLNLFVVIYSADRIKKKITIREILYGNNDILKDESKIQVSQRPDSKLSNIYIPNRHVFTNLIDCLLPSCPISFGFSDDVKHFLDESKCDDDISDEITESSIKKVEIKIKSTHKEDKVFSDFECDFEF